DYARFGRDGARGQLQWKAAPAEEWNAVDLDGTDVSAGDASTDGVPSAEFSYSFPEVRKSFAYRFTHAGAVSDTYTVDAVPRPSLGIELVRYRYPEYTALPDRFVRDGSGDLAALRGSVAELLVRSTNEPKSGALEFGTGERMELSLGEDRSMSADVPIDEEGTYRLQVEDTLGMTNPNPLEYRIRALPDEAPFIRLLEPGEDRDLDESMRVDLRYSAIDDFGLGPVRLVWELSRREGAAESQDVWTPQGAETEASGTFAWDLNDLDLLPGDTIAYHLEVADNNAIDGPRTARTREYVLRFPTMSEMFAEIDRKEESSIEDLRETVEKARKVEERVEELSREMLKQGESSWENQQELERALEQQQNLAEDLQRAREEIESNLQELAESEFATLEAMQKMQQIRKLLDEVASNEMKEALERLRREMEETNPRQQQEDLADFQESQEEMLEQLDRIMENLKQFRLEEKMRAAVRAMEELAARQESVNDKLAAVTPDEEKKADDDAAKDEAPESSDESAPGDESAEPSDQTDEGKSSEDAESSEESDPSDGEASDESESGDESESSEESKQGGEQEPGEKGEKSDADKAAEEKDAGETEAEREMRNLAQEEEALAEEARRMQEELKELAEMTQELRDSQDSQGMQELSEQMESGQVPQTMDEMSDQMQEGNQDQAQEKGEEALTQLQEMLTGLQMQQQGMAQKQIQISQAAINRAVRDLLSLSTDEENLSGNLAQIPRNSASATRSFADEQYLLIQGTERVDDMLREVAKGTPLMESGIGRTLGRGLDSMRDAAFGLENGAVHLAQDDSEKVVDALNGVVIDLLRTSASMSSCPSGMPMSGLMQQLQELSGDQQKLNEALQKLMKEGGMSMDHRLQGKMDSLAAEQRRIQEQLEQLLEEMGSGQGLLGRLDDVEKKLEETAKRLEQGDVDDQLLEDQAWALTRLLDSQRSMRERELGKERQSETGEELADLPGPGALPPGLEDLDRDLREDLLKALDRRYPPKYEELIRRYFRSLSDEPPAPDLP
ncbi:hypothetical protein K8I85_15350, partial [bacterium]|nr:hypothetical protein [bacterium]